MAPTDMTALDGPEAHAGMPNGPSRLCSLSIVPGLCAALDASLIGLSGMATYYLLVSFHIATVEYYAFCVMFVAISTLFLLSRSRMYYINYIMRPISQSDFIISSVAVSFLLFLSIIVSLKSYDIFSTRWLFAFALTTTVSLCCGRILFARLLRHLGRQHVIGRSLVVLGTGEQAQRFLQRLKTIAPYFTTVEGVFSNERQTDLTELEGYPVLGGLPDLLRYARERTIDDIVIALPWSDETRMEATVQALTQLPVNVAVSTDLIGFRLAFRPVLGSVSELPVFEVAQRPISGWSFVLKALEDYVITLVVLILLSPLLIATAVAIKLDSKGPVFFLQKRLGFNNQVFWIYKFRSMYHEDRPPSVTRQATREDPRITPVGRFIRRTSIDELPQLFNVLDGSMSLVGPRPHALDHNQDFGRQIRGYFARHKVKPGITGWAQVNGLRGETDALAKMEARVRHDIQYVENWSLLFDLRILLKTFFVVLFQRNAY